MRECKFKVGEKVRIKSLEEIRQWEKENRRKIPCKWNSEMNKFCNRIVKVSGMEWSDYWETYLIDFDDGEDWLWSEEMFEKLEEKQMNKLELEQQIADLKEKLAKLEEQVKEQNTKAKKGEIWKPDKGERYYYLNGDGESVSYGRFIDDSTDNLLIETGNCYRTKEQAEFEAQCEKYTRLYRRYVEEHSNLLDWSDPFQYKWFVTYDFQTKEISFDWVACSTKMDVYASDKETLKDAIEFIGEDNFLKYVLRVKENNNAEN